MSKLRSLFKGIRPSLKFVTNLLIDDSEYKIHIDKVGDRERMILWYILIKETS